jgi:hypothetical protein
MTASQRAMATAVIYPEPEKGGRGKLSPEGTVSKQMLHKARAVLNTEFVTLILEGALPPCARRAIHRYW